MERLRKLVVLGVAAASFAVPASASAAANENASCVGQRVSLFNEIAPEGDTVGERFSAYNRRRQDLPAAPSIGEIVRSENECVGL